LKRPVENSARRGAFVSDLILKRAEQRVLECIQALRARRGEARTIARALNADRVKNPRSPGKPWTRSNLGALLRTLERRAQALDEGA
jgi:hypothetical protein